MHVSRKASWKTQDRAALESWSRYENYGAHTVAMVDLFDSDLGFDVQLLCPNCHICTSPSRLWRAAVAKQPNQSQQIVVCRRPVHCRSNLTGRGLPLPVKTGFLLDAPQSNLIYLVHASGKASWNEWNKPNRACSSFVRKESLFVCSLPPIHLVQSYVCLSMIAGLQVAQ